MNAAVSHRRLFRTAAAGITTAALAALSLGVAGPAQAAVTATVTVTTPAAVAPGAAFDVTVDVVCPNSDFGTGAITADIQLGAGAAFGQVTDPNFETAGTSFGTNPHHWAATYTFTAPDLATLGSNNLDVATTVTGRPCVNDATGIAKTNTILVADLPAAPVITSAVPGNGQATVTYTPVADPAGAPVTRYEYSVNGATAVSVGLTNPFTAHGLINETSNSITVRAVNIAGPGPWSSAANVTAVGPPAVPTNLAVTHGNQTLSITFSAPPTPINAIDGYQYSTDGGATWQNLPTLSTAYDITTVSSDGTTALANGTAYNVQVRAHNSLGYGPATASVSGTPSTLPDAPNSVSVTSANGAVDLSFTAPADGGAPITDYLYSTDNGLTFASLGSATLPLHITTTSDTSVALTNGSSYAIVLESVNANGVSAPSAQILATPGVAPDKPSIIVSPADGAVLIGAGFTSDGGVPITLAQCQINGGAAVDGTAVIADSVSASFIILGLTNGQTYSFVCRVGNAAGWSPWSDAAPGTPAAVPAAPVLNSVVPGNGTLTVNFTPGADNGSPITGYTIYEDGVAYQDATTLATTFSGSPVVMTGLYNGDPHVITVTATNATGESLPSNAVTGIVGQTHVAVTASSPAAITYGVSIPSVAWSTVPATTDTDWTTQPSCAVYSTSDHSYSTPLTGVQNAGTYVTHCSGGSGTAYYPASYTDGQLTISKASATNVISCTSPVTYDGTAQTPCTSTITGAGLTNTHGTVTYTGNTNAGTATASSTWSDANHTTATATNVTFTIAKATSSTVISCPASVTYTGNAQTPCTAAVTGVGGLSTTASVIYTSNTNVGTATANASYTGDSNHNGSTATQATFSIGKASSSTVITCPASVTYTASAQTPCTAAVTGAGGLNTTTTVTYTGNTNAGTATADAAFAGDSNHNGSTGTTTFTINPATASNVITCPASVTYTGSAQTPCTAAVTGPGGLSTAAAVTYTSNTNAGTATADSTWTDPNHNYRDASATSRAFTISKASATNVISCTSPVTYDGTAQTPCTSTITGAGLTNTHGTVTYTGNTNAGNATASSTWSDANHTTATATNVTFTIAKAPSTTTITCPTSVMFTGSARIPCTAEVTGAGTVTATAALVYASNLHVGTATVDASTTGDSNHLGSTAPQVTFDITKAPSTTTVTCPSSMIATGAALTPCTATTTGAGGLSISTTVNYTDNVSAGTATATAVFAGDSDHDGSTGSSSFTIIAQSSVTPPTVAWVATNKVAARSYIKVLSSLGSPSATISSTTTGACVIKDSSVYFLTAGTCKVVITQGGLVYRTLIASVSKNTRVAAPARVQQLKSVAFTSKGTRLTSSATAQLNALLPKLRAAKIVIVYGFASGKGAIATTRSAARAAAVASYLTAHGVTVASSAGYGSSIAPAAKTAKDRVDIGFA